VLGLHQVPDDNGGGARDTGAAVDKHAARAGGAPVKGEVP